MLNKVSSSCNSLHRRIAPAPASSDYSPSRIEPFSKQNFTSNKQKESILNSTGFFKRTTDPLHLTRQLKMTKRPQQKLLYVEPEIEEDDAAGAFVATPADDIPRNKLTEKLTRGI